MRRTQFAAIVLALVVAVAGWLPYGDAIARQGAARGLERALVTYATARLLNAAISVLQGTEITASLGVGIVTAPGQVLDPINDLIEQFSSVMLAASVAFGLQLLLVSIGEHWVFSGLLSAVAILWALECWRSNGARAWLTRLLVVLTFVRFAVPVTTIGSDLVYDAFLKPAYVNAQGEFAVASKSIGNGEEKSWRDKIPDFAHIKSVAERAVRNVIDLAALFLIQTILFPLLLLWAFVALVRGWPTTLGGAPSSTLGR
jgi:hypothetical protein